MGRERASVQVRCRNVEKGIRQPSTSFPTIGIANDGPAFEPCHLFPLWKNGDAPVNRIPLSTAFLATAALAALLAPASLSAQEPGNVPETKAPAATQAAPAPPAPPVILSSNTWDTKLDWAWLGRFRAADTALPALLPAENRVVFMGDSITQAWRIEGPDSYFPGKPYINRGISGQTTPQMLVRFRQDVIALQPKVVVILAGINDIAGNTGPETLEQIEDNLSSMAELAAANRIRVVMCSVMPAFDFPWRAGLSPAAKVVSLNKWIKAYASEMGYVYVDFHTPMKDERDGLPASLSKDGVHPTADGYAVMAPLAEAGIEKALKAGNRD
jgi:lysophospholipase L1-like esterase